MRNSITIVTGLWDLNRSSLDSWAHRNFEDYKKRFFELIKCDSQMCIWIPSFLKDQVLEIRENKPTKIFIKENEDFQTWFPFWDQLQKIRNNPEWYNFVDWLKDSPQAKLEFYNPMMMTKMFMVNDSALINPFDSDYFYWIDGGITNTVDSGYFLREKVLDNLENYTKSIQDKFLFITYPYEANEEVHGFERKKFAEYCGVDYVKNISRGGFWGGNKESIHDINMKYYELMRSTLNAGYMGADECLFTILAYKYKDEIQTFEIEGNGLIWPFFEKLKEYKQENKTLYKNKDIALYVLTYNSPKQLKTLFESFKNSNSKLLNSKVKVVINNSTKTELFEEYDILCKTYGFIEMHFDNIGICGARQKAAELFEMSEPEFYLFFEDDMFLCNENKLCKCGFTTNVENLVDKSIKIMQKEDLDFLKLSFSEFYGDNSQQWAWYNIPQDIREKYFPEDSKIPDVPDYNKTPKTKFYKIDKEKDLSYAIGEVHYDNWPILFNKRGNKKVFIKTKWSNPYEQTWMSHVFNEQKKGNIRCGVLLASPIKHDRFEHYPSTERKEN